jgi:hypothetical protein
MLEVVATILKSHTHYYFKVSLTRINSPLRENLVLALLRGKRNEVLRSYKGIDEKVCCTTGWNLGTCDLESCSRASGGQVRFCV